MSISNELTPSDSFLRSFIEILEKHFQADSDKIFPALIQSFFFFRSIINHPVYDVRKIAGNCIPRIGGNSR